MFDLWNEGRERPGKDAAQHAWCTVATFFLFALCLLELKILLTFINKGATKIDEETVECGQNKKRREKKRN